MIENYEEKIKEHVYRLFERKEKTQRIEQLKIELLDNWLDMYRNLLENNMNDEMAYNKIISSIKNIDSLLEQDSHDIMNKNWDKKKSARITAMAVMMYILCPVSVIVFGEIGFEILGIAIMFILIASATGLLIYNNMTKPDYLKQDDILDMDFDKNVNSKNIKVRKSVESAMWAVIVAIYLLINLITGAWYITWIIFIIGAAIEKVIRAYFEYKEID